VNNNAAIEVGGNRISVSDLDLMSRYKLIDLKLQIDSELADIKRQIQAAKTRLATTGEYSNPEWFARISAARQIKGYQSQLLQSKIAKKSKVRSVGVGQIFMEIAQRELPQDLFAKLLEAALGELNSECRQ
jgi:hypothetical protein